MKRYALILSFLFAIISLKAQDLKISFAGSGASTTVDNVKVENLTRGTSINLVGTEVLHLLGRVTAINPVIDEVQNTIRIYPNPTTENSIIEFVATTTGTATIELFDISGKRMYQAKNTLVGGIHSFKVDGLSSGIYSIKINSTAYTYKGILISNCTSNADLNIAYQGKVEPSILKSAKTESVMQYTLGNKLKFTATSGIYSIVTFDQPTQNKNITFIFADKCKDADGNIYPVVQIGQQLWMQENLKTTKYRNGNSITSVGNNTYYNPSNPTGAYCYYWGSEASITYGNNITNTYGRLYNWFTLDDKRNIAPEGWHIPTNAEWETLINYSGGDKIAGSKLKESGTTHWLPNNKMYLPGEIPYIGGDNATGFTALPGDNYIITSNTYKLSIGTVGYQGYWWSSNESFNNSSALCCRINYNDGCVVWEVVDKRYGMSVRCVKDN